MIRQCLTRPLVLLAAAAALVLPTAAHQVFPSTIQLRPGGTDYVYVADAGTCPADITAAVSDPSLLTISAVNMLNGNILPGGGASATALNRVYQVFAVTASPNIPSGTGSIAVCWIGGDYPNAPCNENNCSPFTPTVVAVDVLPLPTDRANVNTSGYVGDPIGTLGGEVALVEPDDLRLQGPVPVSLQRTYVSRLGPAGAPQGSLGPNWRHTYDWELGMVGHNVELWTGEGRLVRFEKGYLKASWQLALNQEVPFQLVESGGTWMLGDPRDDTVRTFDSSGRLMLVEDGRGNALSLGYSGARLDTVSDGLGRQLSFTYGAGGELTSVGDGTRTVGYGYDVAGRLASFTDAASKTTTYGYDAGHPGLALLASRTRPLGNTPYSQGFDGSQRAVSQTDALGNAWALAYGLPGGITDITLPTADTVMHEHGAGGALTGWIDPLAQRIELATSPEGRRSSITDRLSSTTSFIYDSISGKPLQITEADGSRTTYSYATRTFKGIQLRDVASVTGPDGRVTGFTYDGMGNPTRVSLPGGRDWDHTYNGRGQRLTSTNPEGGVTTWTYGPRGEPTTVEDPAGNLTSFGYDVLDRLTMVTFADATTASFTHDALDRLLTSTDPLGRTWTRGHDDNGNLTSVQSPDGGLTTLGYDMLDRLISVTDPLSKTTSFAYDELGRVGFITDPRGGLTGYGYDPLGYRTSVTTQVGQVWGQGHDAEGIPVSTTSPRGFSQDYLSDVRGRIIERTTAAGGTIRLGWDATNRLVARTDALSRSASFRYGADGYLDRVDLPLGLRTTLSRNALGQVTSLTAPGGAIWTRQIDAQGHVTGLTDPYGNVLGYTYGSDNLPASASYAGLGTASFDFDAGGRLTDADYSDGLSLDFGWDPVDRLQLTASFSASYDQAGHMLDSNGISASWDDNGLLSSLTYGPGLTIDYTYNADNTLASVTDWIGGQTDFAYDAAGNLTSWLRPNGIDSTFGYDDDGALASIQHGALASVDLTRDLNGRITESLGTWPTTGLPALGRQAWSFDLGNQVLGSSWDPLGRFLGDGLRTLDWDLAGRLTSYDDGTDTYDLSYDGLGTLTGMTSGAAYSYVNTYQLARPVAAIERVGGIDQTYNVWTPQGTLLYQIDAATDMRYFPLFDEQFSTRLVTDDLGAVQASFDYAPWGQVTARTGAWDTRYTWRGGAGTFELGDLYLGGERPYDAWIGRHVSRSHELEPSPLAANDYLLDGGNPLAFGDCVRSAVRRRSRVGTPIAANVALRGLPQVAESRLVSNVTLLPSLARLAMVSSNTSWASSGHEVLGTEHFANHRRATEKFRATLAFLYMVQAAAARSSTDSFPSPLFRSLLEAQETTGPSEGPFEWEHVTPRIGLTYSLGSERKTLLRSSYARFSDQLGVGDTAGGLQQLGHVGYFDHSELSDRGLSSDAGLVDASPWIRSFRAADWVQPQEPSIRSPVPRF